MLTHEQAIYTRNERLLEDDRWSPEQIADWLAAGVSLDVTAGLRKHPHEQHVIFYEHQDGTVVIVRLLHQSMDVESHLPKA